MVDMMTTCNFSRNHGENIMISAFFHHFGPFKTRTRARYYISEICVAFKIVFLKALWTKIQGCVKFSRLIEKSRGEPNSQHTTHDDITQTMITRGSSNCGIYSTDSTRILVGTWWNVMENVFPRMVNHICQSHMLLPGHEFRHLFWLVGGFNPSEKY